MNDIASIDRIRHGIGRGFHSRPPLVEEGAAR
jgi:hypothetical protein